MIYKQETLGLKEGIAMVLIATMARITVTSMAGIVSKGLQSSWLTVLLNGFAAVFFLVIFYRLYKMTGCKGDLHHLVKQVLGKLLGFCITFLLLINILANTALLLRQYGENTVATAMPHLDLEVSIWLYAIVSAVIVHFGLGGLSRAIRLFMPITVVGFIIIGIYLYPFYIPYRIFPWQGLGWQSILSNGITGASYNFLILLVFIFLPYFPRIETAFAAGIKGIALSVTLKIFLVTSYIMTFGVEAASESLMPFYEMARLIYLSRYFQNIEAILILLWLILGLLAISINLYIVIYLFCRMFKLEDGRVVLLLMTLCIGTFATVPSDFGQAVMLDQMYVIQTDFLFYGIPILLLTVQVIRQFFSNLNKNKSPSFR